MHQIFVRAGVNCNRPDSQRLAGAQHAKRYFSTIGYNNFFKHERFLEKIGFGFKTLVGYLLVDNMGG